MVRLRHGLRAALTLWPGLHSFLLRNSSCGQEAPVVTFLSWRAPAEKGGGQEEEEAEPVAEKGKVLKWVWGSVCECAREGAGGRLNFLVFSLRRLLRRNLKK